MACVAARADESSFADPLTTLLEAAESASAAWSGSSLGYHALVYYADLAPPPPGAHFSREWGFISPLQGTTGDWREYPHDHVIRYIEKSAGTPDLSRLHTDATEAYQLVDDAKDDVASMLRAELGGRVDEHLGKVLEKVLGISILSYDTCLRAQLPSGQFMSRDSAALGGGLRSAPHQEVIARVVSLRAPFEAARELAQLCQRAARHLARVGGSNAPTAPPATQRSRVLIGHGRSPLWRELKDFVADRLQLPWDEFNRVSVAGVGTTDRLQQMVESAAVALLVATADDERADGQRMARQNVVHEIGLFQGHLGFSRAIVLIEDGCEEFSNIHGLGQIRFPSGNISASFEDVRRVLEREGLI